MPIAPWIIEKQRREQPRESERPFLELPLDEREDSAEKEKKEERGIWTINLWEEDEENEET